MCGNPDPQVRVCFYAHLCRGLLGSGRCGRSCWSNTSSERDTPGHGRSSPRRPPRSRWLPLGAGSCPASLTAPTGGTRSWLHTPSAFWGTPATRRKLHLGFGILFLCCSVVFSPLAWAKSEIKLMLTLISRQQNIALTNQTLKNIFINIQIVNV